MQTEPIFQLATELAVEVYHNGPRELFKTIASRSAVITTINKALNAGGSLEGATLSGPALIGIPAEFYASPRVTGLRGVWHRLFGIDTVGR
jgi:hypothetical protein